MARRRSSGTHLGPARVEAGRDRFGHPVKPGPLHPRPPVGTSRRPDAPRHTPMPFDGSTVPVGWVAIVGYNAIIQTLQGEEQIKVTAGYGGWGLVTRPERKSITEWQGSEPLQMTVPLMIDSFIWGQSVADQVKAVEQLATVPKGDDQTPTVKLYGVGVPHTELDWVIEDLQWGEAAFNEAGQRVRQAMTVVVREETDDDLITIIKRKPVDCNKAKSRVKKYKVRKGDTLQKIAAKYLGASKCWTKIAKLNKIRDPKKIKVNQTLKLP